MRVWLKNRRFSPGLANAGLAIAAATSFMLLGMWQLDRADAKRELRTQYETGQETTVDLQAPAGTLPRYQQVRTRGHYDSAHQILLDNMPSQQGWAGYRVLTPFEWQPGEWILVDRGWIPLGATRADIPALEISEENRIVVGRLDRLPRPGIRLGEASEQAAITWPLVLSFPQHATLERALDRPLTSGIVLLDPAQPDGFERAWQSRFSFGPNRHIGYAVQWFAFAAAALIIFVILSFKPRVTRLDDE